MYERVCAYRRDRVVHKLSERQCDVRQDRPQEKSVRGGVESRLPELQKADFSNALSSGAIIARMPASRVLLSERGSFYALRELRACSGA